MSREKLEFMSGIEIKASGVEFNLSCFLGELIGGFEFEAVSVPHI
jgi:hypothetical protein